MIGDIISHLYGHKTEVEIERPEPTFGDFATNVALKLASPLRKSPQTIAAAISEELEHREEIAQVTVAGPGFINIRLSDESLVAQLYEPGQIVPNGHRGEVVVIETNNPNPFKDLHIGHAYNCIVADTVANLIELGGAQVHRVGYHGDVGLHVGKSMWAILRHIGGEAARLNAVPEDERPKFMSERYIEGAKAYDEDPEAHAEIEALAKQSFAPEGTFKTVYDICKGWSFDYIDATLARIGSKPAERHYLESEADRLGAETVRAHVGDVFSESNGAIVFAGEAFGLHTRVFIASRGTSLYEARDLGLMQLKQQEFHPRRSFIVTGGEQEEYFKVIFKAAELSLPELRGVTHNISTGTVKLSTGKMSSRTGKVLNIEWLFDQLKSALSARGASPDDVATIIGALRYQMLRVRIGSDVVFDIEAALSLEGNSGPYLQYAHARARSILSKATKAPVLPEGFDAAERELLTKLGEYQSVLERATHELLPHLVCTYLYELSQVFNRFYEKARIIGDERESERLWLCERYADGLRHGLAVLGIPAPEHM